ncbi:MAG: class I SAM-dependent methyltransferase [Bacteroidales bacterium]|nr:class I SAM-dependent methyltransferase [Bacteroidales bacterium]
MKVIENSDVILQAGDVKPNFTDVKGVWAKLLVEYFNPAGELLPQYTEMVSCPHCNSESYIQEFTLNGFRHVKCVNCSSVYVNPRLRPQYIDLLYSDDYYSEMFTQSMIPFFNKRKELIGKSKYNQVVNYSGSKGSVLDVGCGIGEVIDVFRDNHWDCDVIEFNPAAVAWLEKKGYTVSKEHFNDYSTNKKYDVVMAWGVVEHVLDPQVFLQKAFDLLKPGGVFVSEVPHGNAMLIDYCRNTGKDPQRILQGEQHIMLYSIDAYKEIHKNAGFEEIEVKTNGLDISTILNINNERLPSELISHMQTVIDKKNYGDLLRGFWRKM